MALRPPLSSTHNIHTHTHTHRNLYTQRKEEKIQLQLLRYLMHRRGEKIPIRRTINKVTRIVFFPVFFSKFRDFFLFCCCPALLRSTVQPTEMFFLLRRKNFKRGISYVESNFSCPYCINTKCLDGKSFHAMLLAKVPPSK
jgi:hypothetical protein